MSSALGRRRPSRLVALVEDLDDIERVDEQAIVLLTRSASAYASTYRFDVALRIARARKVAAIVLAGADVASITPHRRGDRRSVGHGDPGHREQGRPGPARRRHRA
jgi:hypothetical protein